MASDQLVEDFMILWMHLQRTTHPAERGEITREQYWLLRILRRSAGEPMSIGELAAATGVGQSSITTACKRLERDGLVARRRDAHDERIVRVSLTDAGNAQLDRWRQARRAELAHLLEPLNNNERQTLERLLHSVVERGRLTERRR